MKNGMNYTMNENVLIAIITSITAIISAIITGSVLWWVAIRKTPKEVKVLSTQETLNFTESFKTYAEALDSVVKTVMATNKDLEGRVDELEAHRIERSRQIYELQQTIDDLKLKNEIRDREYVQETQSLRDEIEAFKKKNTEYRTIIEKLLEAIQRLDPTLLEGIDLTETLKKFKAIK